MRIYRHSDPCLKFIAMDLSPKGVRKGAWSKERGRGVKKKMNYCGTALIRTYGIGKWSSVPSRAGLRRCRKSCRLRWLNYLSPSIDRGAFREDEVDRIIRLHNLLGNRWSLIAGRVPGRTANDIKNFWNSYLSKKTDKHSMTQETSNKTTVIRPQPSRPTPVFIRSKNPKETEVALKSEVTNVGDQVAYQIPEIDQLNWLEYPSPTTLENDQAWLNGLFTSDYCDNNVDTSLWNFDDGYETQQIFEGTEGAF